MRAMTKSWNKADRVLFLAFLVFLLALFVHLQLPHSVFASGFLFCAEAALVGGIADWFAVTALFRSRSASRIIRPSCRGGASPSSRPR